MEKTIQYRAISWPVWLLIGLLELCHHGINAIRTAKDLPALDRTYSPFLVYALLIIIYILIEFAFYTIIYHSNAPKGNRYG